MITIAISLSILYSCGGGGGDSAAPNTSGVSVPSGISQTAELEKQYLKKAKELIEIQEGYEDWQRFMTPEKRLAAAKTFEEGKKQLNSLQHEIRAIKNAEKILYLEAAQIEDRYKDRMDEVLLVSSDKSLMQVHFGLINLKQDSLKEIENKSIKRFKSHQLQRQSKQLKVYETDAFVYVQEV